MENLIIVVVFSAIGLFLAFIFILHKDAIDKQEIALQEAQETRRKQLAEQYAQTRNELAQNYGDITIEIPLLATGEGYNTSDYLYFFEERKIILIDNTPILFDSVLSYTLTDNQHTISTTTGSAETSTSTGSIAGRALLGGVLLGGAGALAGAATAKKNTEINTTISHSTSHNYIIYLTIEDISNPQLILKFGSDDIAANKAASLFSIIIKRNNSTV